MQLSLKVSRLGSGATGNQELHGTFLGTTGPSGLETMAKTMMRILIFSFLFPCKGSSESTIKFAPPVVVVRFEDSFSANCSTTASEVVGIGWESTRGGTGLIKDVSSLLLEVDKVEEWDMGPICYTELSNGSQVTETLPVIVYKMPEHVSLFQPESKLDSFQPESKLDSMMEGQQYEIVCEVVGVAPAGRLSVFWYKGDEIFQNKTFKDTQKDPVNKLSFLQLRPRRSDNGNQIWCEAVLNLDSSVQNPSKMKSKSYSMTVFYPPTFRSPANETLDVPAGEQVALSCNASGNPDPVYSWHFSDSAEETSTNQNVNQPILMASPQLSGIYSCIVSNEHGRSTKYLTVNVVKRNRTTFGAILGGFLLLGAVLFITGLVLVKNDGKFSFNRRNPNSSGPL